MRIEQRHYATLDPSQTDQTSEYVIPDGSVLNIIEIGGDASLDPLVKCCVVYDMSGTPDILFSTYSSNAQTSSKQIVGDGVKKITIVLENNSATSKTIGAYWIGEING